LQLGAFYPFSRNHNFAAEDREQDPAKWAERGHPEVTEAARNALYMRYSLLPYLYTLFYRAHISGNTVIRPLFHEYPMDNNTYDIDKQFMWGSSVLISPFLYQVYHILYAHIIDFR
jgi:alpha-glucosidase (family GH31 glycosyl hydrolase)